MHILVPFRLSASCTHVSGLLHALAALAPTQFPPSSATGSSVSTEESEETLPVTSYPCQWKAPRKRKQSNLKMADATFEKHVYGRAARRSDKDSKILTHGHRSTEGMLTLSSRPFYFKLKARAWEYLC